MKVREKHRRAFFEAQGRVSKMLEPYRARSLRFFNDGDTVIETFAVYSKEADADDHRHQWRGIVTVSYQMPMDPQDPCFVLLSFSEDMVAKAIGMGTDSTWQTSEKLVERMIPSLS